MRLGMKDQQKIRDDALLVAKKFHEKERPDKADIDQFRTLPDDVVEEVYAKYPRNSALKAVIAERQEK